MLEEMHKGCGGNIVKRVCTRCGKKWNPIKYVLTNKDFDMVDKSKFNARDYRERIRSRRDIRSENIER